MKTLTLKEETFLREFGLPEHSQMGPPSEIPGWNGTYVAIQPKKGILEGYNFIELKTKGVVYGEKKIAMNVNDVEYSIMYEIREFDDLSVEIVPITVSLKETIRSLE